MNQSMRVAVIGGGAAGMAAALAAASCGDRVTVLERLDRVGKKLLSTGNGRCNLMNTDGLRYPGGSEFARAVLERCGAEQQTAFWRALGLELRQEGEGRVYPLSGQASTVLDVLRYQLERLRIRTVTEAQVKALVPSGAEWIVRSAAGEERFDRVIVTGGGRAQPKLGSDGSAYKLLTALGHHLIQPRPALTQLETEPEPIRGLSGIRLRAGVRLLRNGHELCRERGEVLFTEYGLSGICVMQCSRWAEPGCEAVLNLLEPIGLENAEDALRELQRRQHVWRGAEAEQLLCGLVVSRLGQRVFRLAGVPSHERRVEDLSGQDLQALAETLTAYRIRVTGIRGFESAQVTAGGIAADEFVPETMASRIAKGLHAAGEVLDVDGDCGGFNLMFAFGSGILAGLNGRESNWMR